MTVAKPSVRNPGQCVQLANCSSSDELVGEECNERQADVMRIVEDVLHDQVRVTRMVDEAGDVPELLGVDNVGLAIFAEHASQAEGRLLYDAAKWKFPLSTVKSVETIRTFKCTAQSL